MGKRLTEEQQTKRVQDACVLREVEFLGYTTEYRNADTKLKLRCLKDGHEWDTCRVDEFFNGRGCTKCAIKKRAALREAPEDEVVKGFLATGSFAEGTHFWKLPDKVPPKLWAYHCPICSVDEMVQQGLCSGVFTVTKKGLVRGQISCRCSRNYRWTQEQREYQINKRIAEENLHYKFLGWKGEWKGARTVIHALCEEHGDFFPTVSDFVNSGCGCPLCAKYGFKPDKEAFVYVLLAEGASGGFTGYGVTGDLHNRLVRHRRNLSREGFSIAEHLLFPATGYDAVLIERAIKENFVLCPQVAEGFKTEATAAHLYNDVVKFVESYTTQQVL